MITLKKFILSQLASVGLIVALTGHAAPLNVTVTSTPEGVTPAVLGYNLGHFMSGSNTADWWRYSNVKAARVFRQPNTVEVIHNGDDGVAGLASFVARRAALRANTSDPAQSLDNSYIDWPFFINRHNTMLVSGSNRFIATPTFSELRRQGVELLLQMTASLTVFTIENDDDWAGKWLLWRFYYTQAFIFGREYDVRRYSMFNEPNHANAGGITYEQWHQRLKLASDAIQCALADVNSRYGKSLVPEVFATNTAYANTTSLNEWGKPTVEKRHERFDGTSDPAWRNFHFYNYQSYNTSPTVLENYFRQVKEAITPLVGDEEPYGIGLTEINTSTSANFDAVDYSSDDPLHYAALGGDLVALTRAGAAQLYLFKFGQTARTDEGSRYPVTKNGTHYVNNDTTSGSVNPYGGASQTAEVYRLFNKAARGARPRLACAGDTPPSSLYLLVTRDDAAGFVYIFAANTGASELPLNLDVSALGLPVGNLFTVEEVSDRSRGGVVARAEVTGGAGGGIGAITLRPQSVALVSISTRPQAVMAEAGSRTLTVNPVADAQLADGAGRETPAGGGASMIVRSDGLTADGRRVALIKFPVPAIAADDFQAVLLDLYTATTDGGAFAQAHVYGLDDDGWDEHAVTWSTLASALRQNVPAGNKIANNVVANQGSMTSILGQLVATSASAAETMVDVTDFVRRQDDGFASFLIVQDHRWDETLDIAHTPGDTQPGGIGIVTREGANGAVHGPRLLIAASAEPSGPTLIAQPSGAAVEEGEAVTLAVTPENDAGVTYQWRKDGVAIAGATFSTLSLAGVLSDAGIYDVVVTNNQGSVVSNEALVVIRPSADGSPFAQPAAVAIDRGGNLYVADAGRHVIYGITPDNYVSVFAGQPDSPGAQNAVGGAARFRNPGALAVRDGSLYVADTGNATIRALSRDATVSAFAGGIGVHAHADGQAAAARFDHPEGIASDADGNLYVADTGNHVIRKITPARVVTTIAGKPRTAGALDATGTQALFRSPAGIAASGSGAELVLYVADTGNHTLRKITAATGEVTTLGGAPEQPGCADGTAAAARFREPRGLLVDGAGDIYLADTGNSLIRLVTQTGTVTTIAGLPGADSVPGLAGYKDGTGEGAWFAHPGAIALAENGKLYVADTGNFAVRVIDENNNVTTLPVQEGTPPPSENGNSGSQGGGGGAPTPWMLAVLAVLMLCRVPRR
ncbi:DNRLRE domain-containing protein [Termitidicoccus mucosus]|uniref:Ig-like domain-containing protein n=1 Tax=Termitidicoccus mucosus TaxID=1184151 RepID=A0A178IEX5_9BACT|nr:hypothetical protein AW736_17120 [Opitutaceae bacterium TSB47]